LLAYRSQVSEYPACGFRGVFKILSGSDPALNLDRDVRAQFLIAIVLFLRPPTPELQSPPHDSLLAARG
jgi:hypothetical protein